MDYNHEVVHGYLDEAENSVFALVNEAKEVAESPAFGYNGYYLGGYWKTHAVSGIEQPYYEFYDHCGVTDKVPVRVPLTIAQIRRSTETVAFCSAAAFQTPQTYQAQKLPVDFRGSHLVTPPIVAQEQKWMPDVENAISAVKVVAPGTVYAPFPRYTGAIAVLWADGHADSQSYNALADQRKWVNSAGTKDYQHAVCTP